MSDHDLPHRLIGVLRDGLPRTPRPYAALAARLGTDEDTVIATLGALIATGTVGRFGAILNHHALGYRANAMGVFDIDDAAAPTIGRRMAGFAFVTLCYRRARVAGHWPYNLYCMIHGRDRATVRAQHATLISALDLADRPHKLLFSRRRFKQSAGRYGIDVNVGEAAS